MKIQKTFLILLSMFSALSIFALEQNNSAPLITKPAPQYSNAYNPNRVILPANYKVYVLGKTVLNHPAPGPYPGFKQKTLPTYNFYKGHPGCYIICYSHDATRSIYPVSNTIFVNGQIRVPGHYQGRICQPASRVNQNISKSVYFKDLCAKHIGTCKSGNCWAGGDSGGWFGIQH